MKNIVNIYTGLLYAAGLVVLIVSLCAPAYAGPFTGCPGSLDFLDCPSRTGSRWVFRGDVL